jgi:Phage integrase family
MPVRSVLPPGWSGAGAPGGASQGQSPATVRASGAGGAALTGTPLSHSNFRNRVWLPALAAVGLEGVHVHDLRHTGNQLTANAGANPKELMARMGHDSERAALIYLHSSAERQRTLADEVGRMAAAELAKSKTAKPSGTLTAREPNGPDGPADGKSPDLRR